MWRGAWCGGSGGIRYICGVVFGVVDLEEEDVYCGGSGGAICVVWCLVWWILKRKYVA